MIFKVAFSIVAVYFTAQVLRLLFLHARYLGVRRTAILTWNGVPPVHARMMWILGVISALLALYAIGQRLAFLPIYSQAMMAVYFLGLVPLTVRLRRGFYQTGIWTDTGFVPYDSIGRWAFNDQFGISLLITTHNKRKTHRLSVPSDEYGAANKLMTEKARANAIHQDEKILDL
ncbi:MAG: hypothetical protein MUF51_04360 [Vicinamibacteria bacterium]|jgi:hypothetical protein|nr:hypothetical protein [Vicinamibacteria bacterium]